MYVAKQRTLTSPVPFHVAQHNEPTSANPPKRGTFQVAGGRESSSEVLGLVCEELGIGDPSHFFEV